MQDTLQKWQDRWDKNYVNGYAKSVGESKATDQPMHWYFTKHLFPYWRDLRKRDSVLELGCGNGAVAVRMYNKVKRFVGTDISGKAIDIIRARFEGVPNVKFENTTDLRSLKEKFNLIFAITVFQHIPKEFTAQYLKDCRRILRPGGALFFNVLSGIQDKNTPDINFEDNGICEPNLGFSKEEIGDACEKAGFKNIKTFRMEVDIPSDLFWWYWCICTKDKK